MKEVIKLIEKAKVAGTMAGLSPLEVRDVWESVLPIFEPALPKHFNPAAFVQTAAIVSMNEKLMECDALSVINAAMNAATLGLTLSPQLGEAYIVPYNVNIGTREKPVWKKMAQFQIGFNGYKAIGWRSGLLVDFHAAVVQGGDIFQYEYGSKKFLRHVPELTGDSKRPMTRVYASANLKNGGFIFEVMTRDAVELLRRKNRDQKEEPSGAWVNYNSMAKAKVTKPLFRNYLPLTPELSFAFEKDETVAVSHLSLSDTIENGRAVVENRNPDYDEATQADNPVTIEATEEAKKKMHVAAKKEIEKYKDRESLNNLYKNNPVWLNDPVILDMIKAQIEKHKPVAQQ